MFYTYLLKIENGKYYIGFSSNLKQCVETHKKTRQVCELVYYEAYLTKELAMERELKLKQFGGAWRSLRKRLQI